MALYLTLLLAYSLGLIALGLWIGRLVRHSGDFFVARRRLGAPLVLATVLAANIGAGSTVGATGLGYTHGLSAWWWNGSAGIGSLLLALWIGPRIWRAATRHRFLTVGDFLEHRYGRGVRGAVAALLWIGTLSILAGQLIGLAWILNVVAGVPKWVGCLAGGVVMTSYFAAGGLLGSAWVNLVQLVVLLAGFAVAVPLVVGNAGGWPAMASSAGAPASFGEFWGGARSLGLLTLLGPAFMISPGLLQKVYAARDERALRLGVGLNGVALLGFAFVPALLGMAARALHPDLANPELALPTVFARDLPAWVGALALAAVFSAEISTADAILFMLATSLAQDLYRRFVNPQASDGDLLRIARFAALGGGAAGIGLAIATPGIIPALSVFYWLLGVTLLVPIVAGLHVRTTRAPAAVASIVTGISVDLAIRVTVGAAGLTWMSPEAAGIAAGAVAFAITQRVGRRR